VEQSSSLLFASREGYFLKRIFDDILAHSSKKMEFKEYYFLISRRAVSVPTIKNIYDIETLLKNSYRGSLHELIMNRLGIMLPEQNNFMVEMPRDLEKVMDILNPIFPVIYENAEHEKRNYKKYIDTIDGLNDKHVYMIDLGYSGTAQYYLSKMLGRRIDGRYLIMRENFKLLPNKSKAKACFGQALTKEDYLRHDVARYSGYLESFLTSDRGQLCRFDSDGRPEYLDTGDNGIKSLERIYDGIHEFIEDLATKIEKDILDVDLDAEFVERNYGNIILKSELADEIRQTFRLEDLYISNKILKM